MRFLIQGEGFEIVYITLNKSCVKWDEILRFNGIDTDSVFFIDAISKRTNPDVEDNERVKYISSPEDLQGIMDQVSSITRRPKGNRAFVLDNISSLLVYNKGDSVSRFLHFLYGKAEITNASAVLVSLKDETIPKSIGQYADRIIEVKYVY